MDPVELFLLGRRLMKIAESALPDVGAGAGNRTTLLVASEIAAHPGSTVGEIAARSGLPQSAVSQAVARLAKAGSIVSEPDPADGRRTLLRHAGETSERVAEVRATSIRPALKAATGEADAASLDTIESALRQLSTVLHPREH
ncbi:helix-turn-helix domain-containing protein [Microbacterium kyungheense]|uniref:MarR family transcriptional regulator n=1 Tax=Microbacterium kyungheense TaxID=1263636 RepID=UPI0031E51119